LAGFVRRRRKEEREKRWGMGEKRILKSKES
jgi:hypothetical protein